MDVLSRYVAEEIDNDAKRGTMEWKVQRAAHLAAVSKESRTMDPSYLPLPENLAERLFRMWAHPLPVRGRSKIIAGRPKSRTRANVAPEKAADYSPSILLRHVVQSVLGGAFPEGAESAFSKSASSKSAKSASPLIAKFVPLGNAHEAGPPAAAGETSLVPTRGAALVPTRGVVALDDVVKEFGAVALRNQTARTKLLEFESVLLFRLFELRRAVMQAAMAGESSAASGSAAAAHVRLDPQIAAQVRALESQIPEFLEHAAEISRGTLIGDQNNAVKLLVGSAMKMLTEGKDGASMTADEALESLDQQTTAVIQVQMSHESATETEERQNQALAAFGSAWKTSTRVAMPFAKSEDAPKCLGTIVAVGTHVHAVESAPVILDVTIQSDAGIEHKVQVRLMDDYQVCVTGNPDEDPDEDSDEESDSEDSDDVPWLQARTGSGAWEPQACACIEDNNSDDLARIHYATNFVKPNVRFETLRVAEIRGARRWANEMGAQDNEISVRHYCAPHAKRLMDQSDVRKTDIIGTCGGTQSVLDKVRSVTKVMGSSATSTTAAVATYQLNAGAVTALTSQMVSMGLATQASTMTLFGMNIPFMAGVGFVPQVVTAGFGVMFGLSSLAFVTGGYAAYKGAKWLSGLRGKTFTSNVGLPFPSGTDAERLYDQMFLPKQTLMQHATRVVPVARAVLTTFPPEAGASAKRALAFLTNFWGSPVEPNELIRLFQFWSEVPMEKLQTDLCPRSQSVLRDLSGALKEIIRNSLETTKDFWSEFDNILFHQRAVEMLWLLSSFRFVPENSTVIYVPHKFVAHPDPPSGVAASNQTLFATKNREKWALLDIPIIMSKSAIAVPASDRLHVVFETFVDSDKKTAPYLPFQNVHEIRFDEVTDKSRFDNVFSGPYVMRDQASTPTVVARLHRDPDENKSSVLVNCDDFKNSVADHLDLELRAIEFVRTDNRPMRTLTDMHRIITTSCPGEKNPCTWDIVVRDLRGKIVSTNERNFWSLSSVVQHSLEESISKSRSIGFLAVRFASEMAKMVRGDEADLRVSPMKWKDVSKHVLTASGALRRVADVPNVAKFVTHVLTKLYDTALELADNKKGRGIAVDTLIYTDVNLTISEALAFILNALFTLCPDQTCVFDPNIDTSDPEKLRSLGTMLGNRNCIKGSIVLLVRGGSDQCFEAVKYNGDTDVTHLFGAKCGKVNFAICVTTTKTSDHGRPCDKLEALANAMDWNASE